MALKIIDFDITILEFCDRLGSFRTTRGCSLKGKIEFDQRIKKLGEIIEASNPNKSIGKIYEEDEVFRHCCDRALLLNNIEPDWVNEQILVALLFVYQGQPGLLVQLNSSPSSTVRGTGQAASYAELLAALYSHTQDLEKAIGLAENHPWKEVMGAIKERGEQEVQENKNSVFQGKISREEIDKNRIQLAKMREKIASGKN